MVLVAMETAVAQQVPLNFDIHHTDFYPSDIALAK